MARWLRKNGVWILTDAPVTPPGGGGTGVGGSGFVDITVIAKPDTIPGLAAALTGFPNSYVRVVDATGMTRFRMVHHVDDTITGADPMPAGFVVVGQYVASDNPTPAEADWKSLDDASAPRLVADANTQLPQIGGWGLLALGAQQDIYVRPGGVGGDGAKVLGLNSLNWQFDAADVGAPSDTPVGSSCDLADVINGFPWLWLLAPCRIRINAGGFIEVWDDARGPIADGFDDPPTSYGSLTLISGSTAFLTGLLNGRTVPEFNGETWAVQGNAHTDHPSNWDGVIAGEMWWVMEFDAATEFFHIQPATSNASPGEGNIVSGGGVVSDFGSTVQHSAAISIDNATGPHIYRIQATNSLWRLWVDGVLQYSAANVVFFDPAQASSFIVYNPHGTFRMGEAVFDQRALTSQEADDRWSILFDRWGIAPGDGSAEFPPPPAPVPPVPPPVIPPAPPGPSGSRRLLLWGGRTNTSALYPSFNAILDTPGNGSSNVHAFLDACRAAGLRVSLNCVFRNEAKVNGVFNQNAWLAAFNTRYAGVSVAGYEDVIIDFMVIDEYQLVRAWGLSIPWSVVDNVLARRVSEVFPGFRRSVRRDAVNIEHESGGRSNIRFVNACWNAHLASRGPISTYMATQKAAAARLGVAYWWMFNPPDGGTSGGDMTATQVRATGIPMAQDAGSLGVSVWVGSRTDLLVRTDMRAALDDVRAALVQP